jgi:acetoacetyl-CoA reductase
MKKLVLVTGGTRGIGYAISVALHECGYEVAANYARNDDKAKELTAKYGIRTYKWDVADFDECVKSVKEIEQDFGRTISILVNNAGIVRDGMMHKVTYKHWQEVIDTNLTSCFNMSKAVIGNMREEGFGRIINISSINALCGQMGQTNYSAAKAGVLGFTKSLAKESAAKGVTVNAIAPGYIQTDMLEHIPYEIMEAIIEQIPVKRLGKPEEIARVVTFLASENSGFITGETISVNGGQHME